MGKTSYPSYSTGTVSLNGNTVASTYKKGNNIISNYNMTDDEKKAYEYAQNSLASSLPSVNIFDENTQNNLKSQLDAYTMNGQSMVNSIYTPMLNNLKNDVSSRFGNLDNSIFMDNLNNIEANRAQAVNNLAQDVLSKRNEIINSELNQRYNYLNFLQDLQNKTGSNMLNYIASSQANSNSGNNYNANAYRAENSGILGSYPNLAMQIIRNYL